MPPSTLPTGTVTFLFTDVEGSTKLLERDPEAMGCNLDRHHDLLREAVEARGGVVFETAGDAVYAAFPRAADAVAAALEGQRALLTEPWPEPGPIRVRMGIHTGEVDVRPDGRYFGPPLFRVARLMATGYGAQVLLSAATVGHLRDVLPTGASLRDLGTHRLKDLSEPEQVSQLVHPGLPSEFPELRSLSARPNNLPLQATSFVGRERELARVHQLLDTSRLLTLTGAGGSGKTRLSIEVASGLLDRFPDGVWCVELAALAQPELVPQTVATAMGLREEPGQPILNTLLSALGTKHVLVVLDNCEHLIDVCARLADSILRSCPNVSLLATSREPLAVPGETTWRVPPLGVADPTHLPPIDQLTQFEAVRLFIDRAQAARPEFTVTEQNAPAVAEICYRLDGIPLALELAAARVKALSPAQIAERLDDRFRLLTGGSRTVLPRQQTLRALVDWSYELLSEPEKTLLRRVSVFAGGWTLEAAETVCAGDPIEDWEVLDLLTSLVEKSLVLADEQRDGSTRYRMLETIRQFGTEKLRAVREGDDVASAHLHYFTAFAYRCETGLFTVEQVDALRRLDADYGNLRGALSWAAAASDLRARSLGAYLVTRLGYYWFIRTAYEESLAWFKYAGSDAVSVLDDQPLLRWGNVDLPRHPLELKLASLLYQTMIHWGHAEFGPAGEAAYQAEALAREIRENLWLAIAQFEIAFNAVRIGDIEGFRVIDQAEPVFEEHNRLWHVGFCRQGRGHIALHEGRMQEAAGHYAESLAVFERTGEPRLIAVGNYYLGLTKLQMGEVNEAEGLLRDSLRMFRSLGETRHESDALTRLATVATLGGDRETAGSYLKEALDLRVAVGNRRGIAESLEAIAALLGPNRKETFGLVSAAAQIRAAAAAPATDHEKRQTDQLVERARAQLAAENPEGAGRNLSLEHAIALARRALG